MADAAKAVGLVVALMVAGLLAAFLMPVVIGQFAGAEAATATLDVGNSTELQPNMTATLDSVTTTSPQSATYTINASGQTATATVENGSSQTVTVDGADVTISVTNVQTGQATAEFESPTTYAWGNGAGALWGIIPVILVLAVFLFFVYMALGRM